VRQSDVLEYIVKRFGEQLEDRLNEIRTSRQILSKAELHDEMKELRVQEANLADAIARHGLSDALSVRLKAAENRIGVINRTLQCPEVESTFNLSPDEQREFVLQRADNFAALLRAEPLIARRTLRQHITKLVLTPRQTADGPVFEVTGDVNLFAGDPDVMLSKPLEGIAQHDTLPSIPLCGVFLNPGLGIEILA
jgi:hypothetical protein